MAQIIDGKAIAADIRREVAADVAALSSAHGLVSTPLPFYPPPGSSWIGAPRSGLCADAVRSRSLAGAGAGRGHRGEQEGLADVREHEAQGVRRGRHLLHRRRPPRGHLRARARRRGSSPQRRPRRARYRPPFLFFFPSFALLALGHLVGCQASSMVL